MPGHTKKEKDKKGEKKVGTVKSNLIKHFKGRSSYKTICGLTFEYVEVK